MKATSVPLIVLSSQQDDVEFINRVLRDSGHAAHCHWLTRVDALTETIQSVDAQMVWLFCDHFEHDILTVAKMRSRTERSVPLIAVSSKVTEPFAAKAMCDGAQDLISTQHRARVRAVAERELRAYRLERALDTTRRSAHQYKEQLLSAMAGSDDAIAHVAEGILIEANTTWCELFGREIGEMIGPLMDLFDASCHAALKGALVASQRGQWSNEPLKLTGVHGGGEKVPLNVTLESALYDGEPAVKLTVPCKTEEPPAPETLVEQAISTDPSTGFYHRRRLIEAISERLLLTQSSGVRAIAYIRPDKFGEVAEEIGPLASEEIIVQLAQIIRAAAHPHDIYGRFGGNVFVMWLERGTLRDVEAWSESLIEQIASNMFESERKTLSLTCTIGLAESGPDADSLSDLLRGAQCANRRGRQRGGNQLVLEETSSESTRVQRFDDLWISQIKSALVENRFQLARLSVANLNAEPRALFDTVVKMIDVQGEDVPASTFLPVAGRHKLLRAIDRWVVDTAVKLCADRPEDSLFVKLSAESILDAEFLPWVDRCMKASQCSAHQLCFQISEETATQHLKHTIEMAKSIRAAGFGFAIGHFGIGRDPGRMLTQLQMDYVKLDGSLMQSLATSPSQQAKVRNLIMVAHEQSIETVAERVEDANTMAVLFQLGIGFVQGHYVHEPEVILEHVV